MNLIKCDNYYDIILDCFLTDNDLINTYHIESGTSVENCAKRTSDDLKKGSNLDFFKVVKDSQVIGFFGSESIDDNKFLTGFFLKPEYRTKEGLTEFWSMIKSYFKKDFLVGIYSKNTRAIEFLVKNKATLHSVIPEKNGIFFKVGA